MKLVFLEDVPETPSPSGDLIGPFERGMVHEITPDEHAEPFLEERQAIRMADEPNGGPWELVGEDSPRILTMEEDGDGMRISKPFVYKCPQCLEFVPLERPREPVQCPNPNCDFSGSFILSSPERLDSMWKDGELKPDWKIPDLPLKEELESVYEEVKECIGEHVVLARKGELDVLACWTLASWRKEDFRTCPYLLFRGEVESGKTRALNTLAELAYRGISTVGTSAAYLYRIAEWFDSSVMIDEADNRLDRTTEGGKWMYDFVCAGYKEGAIIGRCRKSNPDKTDRFDPKTFMALASRESFDAAINSRCIAIDMEQNEPEKEDLDEDWMAELRSKLLWVRLFQEFEVPETGLTGRNREKFLPLLAVAERVGKKEEIEEFAEEYRRRTRLSDVDKLKEAIAEILWENPEAETLRINEIKEVLADRGVEISSQYLGKVTSDMGFGEFKHRSGEGTYINMEEAQPKIDYWADYFEL